MQLWWTWAAVTLLSAPALTMAQWKWFLLHKNGETSPHSRGPAFHTTYQDSVWGRVCMSDSMGLLVKPHFSQPRAWNSFLHCPHGILQHQASNKAGSKKRAWQTEHQLNLISTQWVAHQPDDVSSQLRWTALMGDNSRAHIAKVLCDTLCFSHSDDPLAHTQ